MQERWNDNMKVVIVGGVAGGATAAARIRRLNRTDVLIHDLRSSLAVGIDEIAVGIVVIIALGVAIAQGQLQCALRRDLAAELADAFLDSAIDGGVDCVDGFLIRLGDSFLPPGVGTPASVSVLAMWDPVFPRRNSRYMYRTIFASSSTICGRPSSPFS